MMRIIRELDRILRGEATRPEQLRDGRIDIPLGSIMLAIVGLGAIYGLCMSSFSAINREAFDLRLVIAPMFKVPALFILTVIVTYPSLYVFNALVGSQLGHAALLRLIVSAMAVTLMVLASFGTITAFFSFTTLSYSFMILANVAVFAAAGVLGLIFLLQTLKRISMVLSLLANDDATPLPDDGPPVNGEPTSDSASPSALDTIDNLDGHVLGGHVRAVFRIWIVVFGIVGAQMSWILRPFVGTPFAEFQWFRERESNFFESVWWHITQLFT